MILRIVIGAILSVVGFLIVWKSEWMHQNFGTIDWAEQHLGSNGGSRLMYKLIGLSLLFVGFLTITNLHKGFFVSTVGWLFGIRNEQTPVYVETP